jgi:hypothetical protein
VTLHFDFRPTSPEKVTGAVNKKSDVFIVDIFHDPRIDRCPRLHWGQLHKSMRGEVSLPMKERPIWRANPEQSSELELVDANHTIRDPFNPDYIKVTGVKLAETKGVVELVKESRLRTAFPPEEGTDEIPECDRAILPWSRDESKGLRSKRKGRVVAR